VVRSSAVGNAKRGRPRRLPEKLFAVREKLGASQTEMARLIGQGMSSARISEYEAGKREPNLMVLLHYAKAAGISTDNLIDDSVELVFPENLTIPEELTEWRKDRKRIMVIPRRQHQKRLAAKLLQIREQLGLSQTEIVERLGLQTDHTLISMYEHNKRQPPLNVLLAYARLAGVPVEQIIDDSLDLDFETEHSANS
jgi:transcriptional regulator with XRE-family HTH domain